MLFPDLVTPCSLYGIHTSFRIGKDDVIVIIVNMVNSAVVKQFLKLVQNRLLKR